MPITVSRQHLCKYNKHPVIVKEIYRTVDISRIFSDKYYEVQLLTSLSTLEIWGVGNIGKAASKSGILSGALVCIFSYS